MKKSLSLLLLLCILCGSLVLHAFAETPDASSGNSGQDTSATAGVDVVIVLDQSNSMKKKTNSGIDRSQSSDPDDYRLDATAMLIGMLDMEKSRVAIIPFNQKVIEDADLNQLIAVDSKDDREKLITKVYNLKDSLNGGTDYGAALLKAIDILLKPENRTGDYANNQPMIVLMTDGYNDMREIPDVGPNATREANEKTQEAVDLARENGIPIYTVVLDANKKSNTDGLSMEQISVDSRAGADGSIGAGKNPNKLPSFFAKVLADRIGSSTTFKANADDNMSVSGNLYKIKLPLVNNSIKEANIIIPIKPTDNLNRSTIIRSIRIYRGEGTDPEDIMEPYYKYDTQGHFAIIKLRNQDGLEGGDDWVLEYRNGSNPGADISLLYKYDIKFKADLSIDNNTDNRTACYKDDVLTINAIFMKPERDRATGIVSENPSTDTNLYIPHPDDDSWGTIKATYKIRPAGSEEPITEEENGIRLAVSEDNLSFTGKINLTEYHQAGKLPAGTYIITVTADGAGLKRSVDLEFTVQNRLPELVRDNTYTYPNDIEVNLQTEDQDDGASWGEFDGYLGATRDGSDVVLLAEDLFSEPDGEELTFTLNQTSGSDILELGQEIDGDGNTVITFRTQQEQENGPRKNKSGQVAATLTANDSDNGTCAVDFVINVISRNDIFWSDHEIKILTTTADAKDPTKDQGTFKKHQDVIIWVYLEGANGDAALQELRNIDPVLEISKPRKVGQETDPVDCQEDKTDSNFPGRIRYKANTGGEKTDWTITLKCKGKQETKVIHIPNTSAPAVKTDVNTGDITVKRAGGWAGALIGSDTPSQNLITGEEIDEKSKVTFLVIYPKEIFADEDGDELKLKDSDPARKTGVISAPKFYKPGTDEELPEEMIKASLEGDHYKIEYSADNTTILQPSYQCEMRITAVDEDGLETTYTRLIEVQNLHKKVLGIALATLIVITVLVILFLIIHQIRKPRFPMLNMTIREEPSLFTSASETLSPVKTPTNVNAMGVDSDMAARHNVSMELLQNVVVKPIRSAVSVGVSCRKMIGGHEVTLEDVKLKPKKQYTWKLEQELIIRNMNGEGMIAIKLEDRSGDNEADDVMSAFGGEDGWSSSDPGMANATYSASKHSRKVKKKAVQTEEDNAMGGGNDDFDF